MQATMTMDSVDFSQSIALTQIQQMPLTFFKSGELAHVLNIRGNDEVHHHLENLGFVPDATVKVLSEQAGNIVVEVKGAQIALDKSAASKIIAW